MRYELINPSDKIFYEAENKIISALVTSFISNAYGGKCLDDEEQRSPIFLFSDPAEWLEKETGLSVEEIIKQNAQSIYDAFMSFRYEDERSSLTKIVDIAHRYGNAVKEKFIDGQEKKEIA